LSVIVIIADIWKTHQRSDVSKFEQTEWVHRCGGASLWWNTKSAHARNSA